MLQLEEQCTQSLGVKGELGLSGAWKSQCGWTEAPSQDEGTQGGQEKNETEDERGDIALQDPWAKFRSLEAAEEEDAMKRPGLCEQSSLERCY
jgi:hypothetical protein